LSLVFFSIGHNGGGMLRAALGIASLSAVKNLIGIANLASCSSPPTEIYRLLAKVIIRLG